MTSAPQSLLIELGTEELPPKALDDLIAAFSDGIVQGLIKRGVSIDKKQVHAYGAPRRLAVLIDEVPQRQPDQTIERRGPAYQAGMDAQGLPTPALQGFARSCGVEVADLEKLETDKGSWFVHRAHKLGEETVKLIPAIAQEAIKSLPIPKPMRWGDRELSFIRPVHWLVMLLGDQIIEGELLGLKADRMSRGHRFHAPKSVWIARAEEYVETLRSAHVMVDQHERRAVIVDAVDQLAKNLGGAARKPQSLLDEVKHLVEWPVAIACTFERDFLSVPAEALVMTMESNQKFFSVEDNQGNLSEHFIGIANIESTDPAQIRKGYERVIRPRFADAKFFYEEDLKTPLAQHQESLKTITYQQQLGSVWDKVCRVGQLALYVAKQMQAQGVVIDPAQADLAARLYKCDLMTRMVGEFPELQGVMGRNYALAQGVAESIARAIEESYWPRFAGDAIAASALGRALAIAEKLDTLAGLFTVGQKPSGNKDPFSLRRQALGLARTLIEADLDLDIHALMHDALELAERQSQSFTAQKNKNDGSIVKTTRNERVADLYDFLMERLRAYYAEQGIRSDVFDAVLVLRPVSLSDFNRRIHAVVAFARLPEANALAAANKRIGNMLRQAQEKNENLSQVLSLSLLKDEAEKTLANNLAQQSSLAKQALGQSDYLSAFKFLAALRASIDLFFEHVMVMDDDPQVRANRLALLRDLRSQFLTIADIGLLQS